MGKNSWELIRSSSRSVNSRPDGLATTTTSESCPSGVSVSRRCPEIVRVGICRPASQGVLGPVVYPCGTIGRRPHVMSMVRISNPFPDVPGHVHCTIWTGSGRSRADSTCVATMASGIGDDCLASWGLVAPGVDSPISATRRLLPFGFCTDALSRPFAVLRYIGLEHGLNGEFGLFAIVPVAAGT